VEPIGSSSHKHGEMGVTLALGGEEFLELERNVDAVCTGMEGRQERGG